MTEKILEQHVQLDKQAGSEKELSGAACSYVYDEKYQERHLEQTEEKIKYPDDYLKTAKERKGVGGEEVKSNVTDNASAKIKGARGYIPGYNGTAAADSANQMIAVAEAYGSGYFPEMLDNLKETVKGLSGEEEPLEDAIAEGDTGYFTEKNQKAAEERKIEVIIPDQQFRKRDEHFDGRTGHGGRDGLRWEILNMKRGRTSTDVLRERSLPAKDMYN